MIVVTGAAGFIGSSMVSFLNQQGIKDLLLVDEFSRADKLKNLDNKHFLKKIHRDSFIEFLKNNNKDIEVIIHLGARTDTTETDIALFNRLNLNYTKSLWELCTIYNIPFIYASSAATYGLGEYGYKDDHALCRKLQPLNAYGKSKNDFDKWMLQQEKQPPFWAGLKFFNVYGPNEYHKGRMASVIFHTFRQIKATGGMKLFRSHKAAIADGQQQRDFIYIKDVVAVIWFLLKKQPASAIYNLGTGHARTFWDLAANTFKAMDLSPNISFIDTPLDIRDKYQYFTEADMTKLQNIGYDKPFYTLEEGIYDYVNNYLGDGEFY